MIKSFTRFRIAKHFLLLNAIFLLLSFCIVNISFAAEEFPWEIFIPAITKKSAFIGFTQDELIGKTYQVTEAYPTCVYDITFINDHQFEVPGGEIVDFAIENGTMVISDPPVSTTISVLSRNDSIITASVSVTGGTFVDVTDGIGGLWGSDFSSLNNSATALKDLFIAAGFWPGSTVTADGRVTNDAASFYGNWWIDNNVFYFAYPEEDGCVDYKAYKLVNDRLLFATDADNTATFTFEEK